MQEPQRGASANPAIFAEAAVRECASPISASFPRPALPFPPPLTLTPAASRPCCSFAFIEFVTRADAERALAATNNWPFDASHTLHVYHYEAAKELLATPDDAAAVAPRPHASALGSEPLSWLTDAAARDQFFISWHNQLREPRNEVLWSDARSAPAVQFAGGEYGTRALEAWSSALSMKWSPQGTFIASMHPQGVRLWSGRDFEYGIGFKHDHVRAVSRGAAAAVMAVAHDAASLSVSAIPPLPPLLPFSA